MKYILSRDQLLNEGARLDPQTGEVLLTWNNNHDRNEVLKTNRGLDVTRVSGYPIYYGLEIDGDRLKELAGDPMTKFVMDQLKDAKIANKEQDLSEFIDRNLRLISRNTPFKGTDFVIPLGSTKALSYELGDIASKTFTNAKVVQLGKHEFSNLSSALDWNYIEEWENRVGTPKTRGKGVVRSLIKPLKTIITNGINSVHDEEVLKRIKKTEDWQELRELITNSDIDWKDIPYIIRSSGETFRGSRKFFKSKYNTPGPNGDPAGDPGFIEAVEACLTTPQRLLIVDDNARSKTDVRQILDVITRMSHSLKVLPGFEKRIAIYVLIYAPDTIRLASDSEVQAKRNEFTSSEEDSKTEYPDQE